MARLLRGRMGWGLLALVVVLAWPSVHARTEPAPQAEPVLKAELTQFLVVREGGKEVLKPVESVKPGDLVEYRVTYTNRDTQPVRDVQAELPIPRSMEYERRTAWPAQTAQATADGVTYGREPLMRTGQGGQSESVPYSEYRHFLWSIGQIAPGAQAQVAVRARVAAGVPAASAAAARSAARATPGR
jgi:hypothetical protein